LKTSTQSCDEHQMIPFCDTFSLSGVAVVFCCRSLVALSHESNREGKGLIEFIGNRTNFSRTLDMRSDDTIDGQGEKLRNCDVKMTGLIYLQITANSSHSSEIHVGPDSTRVKCTHCHAIVTTRTRSQSSMSTHVVAAMLVP
jgi:hypothetical protein